MKIKNWTMIDEAGSYEKLPVGGYVARIEAVEDSPKDEYLTVTWDVAEGEHAGHYKDDEAWRHQFRKYYSDKSEPFFRAFLARLEESNRAFSVAEWEKTGDERALVGLEFGALVQERYYTNGKGEDKTALEVAGVVASQDVRNGDFKLPAPRDTREKVPGAAPAVDASSSVYEEDIPF